MSRRLRLGLAGAGISVALVLLMVTAIRAASTYYYTLPQFRALGPSEVGRPVKVNGTVGPGVQWDYQAEQLRFDVVAAAPASGSGSGATPASASSAANAGAAPLPVVYHGAEPDTFAPGISVVVSGRLQPSGTFVAEQVLVKCPSTYVAATSNG
jgi:cytochrome c-type biogenesis protein CcmE